MLWRGGISFGGVVSFIFADLIVLPILDIYRKYYGWRVTLYLLAVFYATMAAAGYVVELLFATLGLIPTDRDVAAITQGPSLDYTSFLNVAFLLLSALLVWRFLRTGGPAMLAMMDRPMAGDETVVDPVCGMRIEPSHAAGSREHRGRTYHFCSDSCLRRFDADPGRDLDASAGRDHAHHHGG